MERVPPVLAEIRDGEYTPRQIETEVFE
jgi:hypothetical protein